MPKFDVMAASLAVGLVLGAVCGASGAAAQGADVEMAKQEGTVVLYTGNRTEVAQKQADLFTEKYGIKVDILRGSTADVAQRIQAETQAGRSGADIVHCLCQGFAEDMAKKGVSAPFKTSHFDQVPEGLKDRDGHWMANRVTFLLIAYNKDKINTPLKSWKDLLRPDLVGKTSIYEPTYTALIMVDALASKFGWGFFEDFGRTSPIVYKTYVQALQWISTSERWVGIVADYDALAAKERGEPIEIVYPEEGVIPSVGVTFVMKDAPHPNAARLFAEWLLSNEGQQSYIDSGQAGVRTDMAGPKDAPSLASLALLPVDFSRIAEQTNEMIARYKEAITNP